LKKIVPHPVSVAILSGLGIVL